jgi:DNA-binding SARP family transcriptional activator
MIELRTLGALDLKASDGTDLGAILAQPKRLSLLVYLALRNGSEFASRDTLLALFWPELDDQHARGALRQALRFLRRSLGESVVVRRGEGEIGLCQKSFWCDTVAFDRACDAGETAEAAALYRGDFLGGFHAPEVAPEFDLWLETERARLRGRAAQAAWALAARHKAAADFRVAAEWARRAASLSPDDEDAQRLLITMLDQAGDRAGAVRVYQQFSRRLEQEFDVEPAAATRQLIGNLRVRDQPEPLTAPSPGPPLSPAVVEPFPPELGPASLPKQQPRERQPSRRAAWGAGLAAVLMAAFLAAWSWWPGATDDLDPNQIAVFPFRVGGPDSGLTFLREGMVDLLATRLSGEGSARAVDPRTAIAAWRAAGGAADRELRRSTALRTAGRLGAGRLLTGEVTRSATGLVVLTSSLITTGKWQPSAQASVQGPIDSLPQLIDQLTARLLVLQSGQPYQRLAVATTARLPALHSYLDGWQSYRRGRYPVAMAEFQRAVDLDPAFALAGMGLASAAAWTHEAHVRNRGFSLAWLNRERLSGRDRALLTAYVGPRYPAKSSWSEVLAAWELATAVAPDQPEAWYELGDLLFHVGPQLAVAGAHRRAAEAFRRAVELDSSYAGPLAHLVDLSALTGDTTGLRRYGVLYLAADSSADAADFVRWRVAVGVGDRDALRVLRGRFDRMDTESLRRILGTMQLDAIGWEDVDRVAEALRRNPGESIARTEAAFMVRNLALNRGRPHEGSALARQIDPGHEWGWGWLRIEDALFTDGDTATAVAAARDLETSADALPASGVVGSGEQALEVCILNLWRMARGERRGVPRAVVALRSTAALGTEAAARAMLCAAMLDAMLASVEDRGDADVTLNRVDSMELAVPNLTGGDYVARNLILARLHEVRGDRAGALAAVRRRGYSWLMTPYLSTFFREEGRLAALTGDRTGAIRAYQRYLTLRSDPEPELRGQVDGVRAELRALQRGLPQGAP